MKRQRSSNEANLFQHPKRSTPSCMCREMKFSQSTSTNAIKTQDVTPQHNSSSEPPYHAQSYYVHINTMLKEAHFYCLQRRHYVSLDCHQ
ncbi:protein VCF1 isoform X3 [Pelobates fuscus]|uniref:protein VCF1 isoform X3 n=1 Tax=Pelobates fuscus TaxID=191477 RepID=UPI002FE4358A